MADTKKKKTSTTVRTRVVEAESAPHITKKSPKTTTKKPNKKTTAVKQRKASKKVGYFKGAWIELKQVRWPNRKATWSLTLAVIVFSMFFTALILLLDAGAKYLFDFIVK